MKYVHYDPVPEKGGCIYRSFSKLLNKDYEVVKKEISDLATELQQDKNDIITFETYLEEHGITKIDDYKDKQIKDLDLKGEYCIFCYDKKDFYHMVTIIDNTLYDKNNNSLDLYVISTYKK